MFTYHRRVFLKDTDATGVIYFTKLLEYAQEAFEEFLSVQENVLSCFFSQGYLFPIVHVEADYQLPLRVEDQVRMDLSLKSIGRSSFSIEITILRLPEEKIAGKAMIVHAFLRQASNVSEKLPEDVVRVLELLHRDNL